MKIAILGGAFNPPHLGHLIISRQVLEFTDTDQVWITPCFKHSFRKELVDADQRLAMAKYLENGNIFISDLEIKNRLDGNTITTLKTAQKQFPLHEFSFIIGSDNLCDFKKWGQWEELISSWNFLVFPRPGFGYDLAKYGLNNPKYKFTLIQNELLTTSDISSTLIRKRLQSGYPIDYLLPEKVQEYIHQYKLYSQ